MFIECPALDALYARFARDLSEAHSRHKEEIDKIIRERDALVHEIVMEVCDASQ